MDELLSLPQNKIFILLRIIETVIIFALLIKKNGRG